MLKQATMAQLLQLDADLQTLITQLGTGVSTDKAASIRQQILTMIANETADTITSLQNQVVELKKLVLGRQ